VKSYLSFFHLKLLSVKVKEKRSNGARRSETAMSPIRLSSYPEANQPSRYWLLLVLTITSITRQYDTCASSPPGIALTSAGWSLSTVLPNRLIIVNLLIRTTQRYMSELI
jgi:hypothetical protein